MLLTQSFMFWKELKDKLCAEFVDDYFNTFLLVSPGTAVSRNSRTKQLVVERKKNKTISKKIKERKIQRFRTEVEVGVG